MCDVGRAFELYFDFAGNGRGYDYFPNARAYRVPIERLNDPATQALFRTIWTEPRTLDPRTKTAEVTRAVAARLAEVSRDIEADNAWGGGPLTVRQREERLENTALFVMKTLFCMFAEDVGLLPKACFADFLKASLPADITAPVDATRFQAGLKELWRMMATPGPDRVSFTFGEIRYFNGGLFESTQTFPLSWRAIHELHEAARQQWAKVEPAIFGTLLEQALSTNERAKLGAHYTPRPYVERLVRATIMEVLEAEWREAETAIAAHVDANCPNDALACAVAFHGRLKALRVLDPACGTGNFLYVAMELILNLEARVRERIATLGGFGEPGVVPDQFLGLELNPRAAVIADLLVWIGWLRWRAANVGGEVAEPVLRRTNAINGGKHGGFDALLQRDETGEVVALPAAWPDADFIVGNPPFIGKGEPTRKALGDAYVETLRATYSAVPGSADLVMYWWERAADALTRPGARLTRFGFVTTNSITQTLNRRVVEAHLGALSLTMAIPDHPWVKAAKKARRAKGAPKESDPAAVRIAMTVAQAGASNGCLLEVVGEAALDTDTPLIRTDASEGRINADLTVGADVTGAKPLKANDGLSHDGVKLHGKAFAVTTADAIALGLNRREGLSRHIRAYRNGRDLNQSLKKRFEDGKLVIDLFGIGEAELRSRFPEVWQHLWVTVKATRDKIAASSASKDAREYAAKWWLFGKTRSELRKAIEDIRSFIGTVDTAKHRVFQFIDADIVCDDKVVIIATDSPFVLGVLQSRCHTEWATRVGGWLGLGNDPVYVKSKCFDAFPFPDATPAQREAIGTLADELDATRKAALAEHPRLTMTGLYNLVALIRAETSLTPAQEADARDARAWIVRDLHDRLDVAVAAAYGWPADLPPTEIVARLVALNAERAAEEKAGHVRWLRPVYQARGE